MDSGNPAILLPNIRLSTSLVINLEIQTAVVLVIVESDPPHTIFH